MIKKLFALLLSGCLFSLPVLAVGAAELDPMLADALSSSAIVATKRIAIPKYPKAYNPSLIPYKEGYLLSFRVRKKFPESGKETKPRTDASFIGVVELDKNFAILKNTVQLLDVTSYSSQVSSTAEDARLLNAGGRIYLFFNDLNLTEKPGSYALYFGELVKEGPKFVLKRTAKHLNYSKSISVEKNWSPFIAGDKIYVIYSDLPRVVLEVDPNTGDCSEVTNPTSSDWKWDWGIVRGGTPAYLVDDKYITFFHSVMPAKSTNGKSKYALNYVMAAYLFEKDPPFAIRAVTPAPLGELRDYTENNPRKVVFPGGVVVEDNRIHVAWGKTINRYASRHLTRRSFLIR